MGRTLPHETQSTEHCMQQVLGELLYKQFIFLTSFASLFKYLCILAAPGLGCGVWDHVP